MYPMAFSKEVVRLASAIGGVRLWADIGRNCNTFFRPSCSKTATLWLLIKCGKHYTQCCAVHFLTCSCMQLFQILWYSNDSQISGLNVWIPISPYFMYLERGQIEQILVLIICLNDLYFLYKHVINVLASFTFIIKQSIFMLAKLTRSGLYFSFGKRIFVSKRGTIYLLVYQIFFLIGWKGQLLLGQRGDWYIQSYLEENIPKNVYYLLE